MRRMRSYSVRLQSVAADHLQLPGDDPVHGDPGVAVVPRHEAHLHVASTLAQARNGVETGVGMAERVDGGVGAAAGQVAHLPRHVRRPGGVHRRHGPHSLRHPERPLADVHRHHIRAQRRRDHHRRQPHPTAPVHGHPVTPRHSPLGLHRPERGRKAAAQTRGFDESHLVGQRGQGEVGVAKSHALGEPAPTVESRLELAVTDLLVACSAGTATAAPRNEGHGHPIARSPPSHVTPHLLHHPAISCPGTCGRTMSGSCPTHPCQSLRQTPLAWTLRTTPSGAGSGSGSDSIAIGPRYSR